MATDLFKDLKKKYTTEEAKKAIDAILKKTDKSCAITFLKTNCEIKNSYKVNSKDDWCIICEIIARAGVTKRDYKSLVGEWEAHNIAYKANIGKDHARDVNLDYAKSGDSRKAVKVATKILAVNK